MQESKNEMVSIRFTAGEMAKIDALSQSYRRTRSEFLRLTVIDSLLESGVSESPDGRLLVKNDSIFRDNPGPVRD